MKTFSELSMREVAKYIYDFAIECAEQVVETRNDHGDNNPFYDYDVPTRTWICEEKMNLCELKVIVYANFVCNTTHEVMENQKCNYIRVEYVIGTPEQDNIYNAYCSAIEYELQKIAGYDCSVCVD